MNKQEKKAKMVSRLHRLIGQIEALERMVEREEDCVKVLTQMKASQSAFKAVAQIVAQEYVNTCLPKSAQVKDKDKIEEVMKLLTSI